MGNDRNRKDSSAHGGNVHQGNPKMGGLVKTMNMTKNAIMHNAAFLCSIPVAGDELQTIKDKWQGNFDQLIYQITEGVDRGRARAYGGVEDTKTWKNSFIFTGEEPITKVNSGGGSKNRVIEIAIDGPLIEDGHYVSSVVQEHYGYAGRKFVEYIQETDLNTSRNGTGRFLSSHVSWTQRINRPWRCPEGIWMRCSEALLSEEQALRSAR
ncbi:MAG: DUF927 domain-containing protein [Hungatella sp.]